MPRFSPEKPRWLWLAGLTLAILLGILGHSCHAARSPDPDNIRTLDRRARPYFEEAHRNVPQVVSNLTTGSNLPKLALLMTKDKLSGGHETLDHLRQVLQTPILTPCRQAARIYGITLRDEAVTAGPLEVVDDRFQAALYAAGGLALEGVFLKSTMASISRVIGAIVTRLAGILGTSAACAAGDGPFPLGDCIGAVMAIGGTALCLKDLANCRSDFVQALEAELHQTIDAFQAACREAVMQ